MPRHGHRGYAAAASAVGTAQIGLEGLHAAWGMHHKRQEGVESDGVGWLNLPVNQDKHRADKFSQRVRTAIEKKKKSGRKKRRRGRAKRTRARKAARVTRARQKDRLVRVATYNVRTLAAKGANGYGRD